MVEGYTDVISMHQCGIENVVANSGTALSEHQIHLLHRFTHNIVLLYDGDEAGIKAALRGTDMLLKEGMNVKVMLLPDGDDPDSFARKHSADEFRAYIKEHQTDFIEFKTKVLLQGVSDPRERSEAISSIIQSISVISDPIVRATYIQDCSVRLGYSEQTLTAKLNDTIRANRQQQRHVAPQPQQEDTDADNTQQQQEEQPQQEPQPQQQEINPSTLSSLIIKEVIKHGSMVIYDNIETEDGSTMSLTLAEFVDYNLKDDGLQFAEPIYNQILAEAVARCKDDDFDSEKYFLLHPDYDISRIAITLCSDNVILSKSLQINATPYVVREQINHLLLDFRNEYIMQRIRTLSSEVKLAADDPERQMQLMAELQQAQRLRTMIAKKIGTSVITRKI